jgi:hypothetical protein
LRGKISDLKHSFFRGNTRSALPFLYDRFEVFWLYRRILDSLTESIKEGEGEKYAEPHADWLRRAHLLLKLSGTQRFATTLRNCDRHAEEETRVKPPQKIEKDELRQKEHQTVQSMQENQGVGLPSTPQALILRMRSHFFLFLWFAKRLILLLLSLVSQAFFSLFRSVI